MYVMDLGAPFALSFEGAMVFQVQIEVGMAAIEGYCTDNSTSGALLTRDRQKNEKKCRRQSYQEPIKEETLGCFIGRTNR